MAQCIYPPYVRGTNPYHFKHALWRPWEDAESKKEAQYNQTQQWKCDQIEANKKKTKAGGGGGPKPNFTPPGGSGSVYEPPENGGDVGGAPDGGDNCGGWAGSGFCPPDMKPNPGVANSCIKCDPGEPQEPIDDSPQYEPGSKDDCCDRTASGLSAISAALAEINKTLNDKLGDGVKCNDKCIDDVIDKLRKRFEKGTKSCDECRTMLRNGLGGTLEYAVACAGACLDKAKVECSMGDPDSWGLPCEGCGEPCCICKDGTCSPTPCKEDDKPKKFIAWCNPSTGSIAVTREGASPPGQGFFRVGMSESEEAAATLAAENCEQQGTGVKPLPGGEIPSPVAGPPTFCDFDAFINYMGAENVARHQSAVNAGAGIAQATNAILKFGFEGINPGVIGEVVQGAFRATTGAPGYFMQHLMPTAIAALGCDNDVFKSSLQMLAGIESIAKLAGTDVTPWTDQIRYIANANCRMQFMTPDQAMAAYLSDAIDYKKLDGHWAIANICPEALNSTLEASRAKPVPLQLAMMRRRKMIDAGGYASGMRRLGYVDSQTPEQLFQLTEQVPTMSDLIRLMVRDAGDESIATWPESDRIFTQKFGGKLKEWADFQGLTPDMMKYVFRAHWSIPAPGQLFRFYQRLRDNPRFGGRDKLLADVKNALIQQDILPFWHDHFLAVSYLPIGRIDIRRAFNIGSMTDDELVPAYAQLGYSDADCERLAKFSRRLRADSAVNHRAVKLWQKFAISRAEARTRMVDGGLPSDIVDAALSDAEISFATSPPAAAFVRGAINRQQFTDRLETAGVTQQTAGKIADQLALKIIDHPAAKGYAIGAIDADQATSAMLEFGMSNQVVDNIIANITQAVDYAFLAACQKGIKRRYLMGEFNADEASSELVNRGTSMARANKLVDNWNCERSAVGKSIPTNRLCNWLADGTISSLEFSDRLETIGHTAIDAARIRDDCLASISVKRQKQADKEAREHVALERREEAALKRQSAAIQRISSQQYAATQKAARTQASRQKQYLSAAVKVSKKCDCDLYDSQVNVKSQADRVRREYGLTIDESLQLVIKAAEAWEGGEIATYHEAVTTLALGLSEPEPIPVG